MWSGGVSDGQQGVRTVTGSSPTVKGMWVCGSGAATGENCGIKVSDTDVMQVATLPRSGATYTVRHTARATAPTAGWRPAAVTAAVRCSLPAVPAATAPTPWA